MSSQSIPVDEKCIPLSECSNAKFNNLFASFKSFTCALVVMLCNFDTLYDKYGRTCRAIHAIDATTLLKLVISTSVHLSINFLFVDMLIGRIVSILSFAVTVIL